jgi:hypothetical protein
MERSMRKPRVTFTFPALLLLFSVFSSFACFAQTATVQSASNLRKAPNTNSAILESLSQGDTVTLTSSRKRSGYYQVRAGDGTLGWVWSKNVSIGTTAPANNAGSNPVPTPPAGIAARLAAASVKAVPKPLIINGQTVCGATGDSSVAKTMALDGNKNRTDIPDASSYISVDWNVLSQLPSGAVGQLQGAPVEVEGYLSHKLNVEGAESTNCHLTQPDEVDWHMYLTNQPAQEIADAIIVETTPRTSPLHSWDQNTLNSLVNSHTRVRVGGWLMYDWQHLDVVGKQRATVWEVHPITRIETQDSSGNWQNIEAPQ